MQKFGSGSGSEISGRVGFSGFWYPDPSLVGGALFSVFAFSVAKTFEPESATIFLKKIDLFSEIFDFI